MVNHHFPWENHSKSLFFMEKLTNFRLGQFLPQRHQLPARGQVQLSPRATPGAFDDNGQRLSPLQPAVLYLRQGRLDGWGQLPLVNAEK